MGFIEKIPQFAGKHAFLTATAAVTTAVGGGYFVYDNYKSGDRAADGTVVKQDVAVNDKDGALRMKMRGLKGTETPKAAEVAKADAKAENGDAAKKLREALKEAKDAEAKAETLAEVTPTAVEAVSKPEKPYIPEQAANNAYDETSANVLDGGGSAVFRPARFASSGSGSAAYEQNRGNKASAKPSGVSAIKPTAGAIVPGRVGAVNIAGAGEKAGAAASGKSGADGVKTTKSGGNADKGGDGSKTETGKELASGNENAANGEGETPTGSGMTPVTPVMPKTSIDATVSTAAAPVTRKPSERFPGNQNNAYDPSLKMSGFSNFYGAPQQTEADLEKERLRKEYLRNLEDQARPCRHYVE